MDPITLNFLGGFQVISAGANISRFRGDKVRGLLAYLAVEADRPHARATLAALFWPDQPERLALANLSQTLTRLRAAIGADGATQLDATRDSILWRSGSAVDVANFTRLAGSRAAADLQAAAALYRGEFLAGFGLDGCDAFEEWLLLHRERLLQLLLGVLEHLAELHLADGQHSAAATAARQQLLLDPWRETAHRQLMRALSAAGDRAAALAAYEHCRQTLLADLGVAPDAATTAVADQIRQEQPPGVAAVPPSLTASLPAALTPLLGRSEELALLEQLLHGQARLVTVLGPGGVGKTRLAFAAATFLRETFSAGACWVPLVGISATSEATAQADGVVGAILAALGMPAGTWAAPTDELRAVLRERTLLLVLDNCEHLPAVGPLVEELLAAAPGLRVLATSRERLGVYGEELLFLGGLAVPDEHTEELMQAAAVQLFVARAQRQVRRFGEDGATLLSVARLCRLLEGMPLGIELAAHWVGDYSPDEIATALRSDLAFLQTRDRQTPDRHRSLRAVFDYSWRLLSQQEQQALARLAVFAGGFDRAAALAVTETRASTLAALVDKSLLRRLSAGRYSMHELLRQFAAEQLDMAGADRATVEARQSDYYLTFLYEREQRLTRNQPRQVIAEIRADLDNVCQAWAWAASHARLDQLDRVAHTLGQFYMQTGMVVEAGQLLALAADHIRTQPAQPNSQRVLSKMLAFQSMALNLQGTSAALPLALQAIELAQASGCLEAEGMASIVQGSVLGRRGALLEAQPVFERTLQLIRNAPDSELHAEALSEIAWRAKLWLGIIALMRDDYAEARAHIGQARQMCQARLSLVGEMNCLHRLITIALTDGDYAGACRDAEQALMLARTLGYRWGEGVALLRFGQALHAFGEYRRAAELFEEALAIFHEIGDRAYAALTLAHQGRLATSLGDEPRARERLELALRQSQELQAHEPALDALLFLALLLQHTGDYEQALSKAEQAAKIAERTGSRARLAQVLIARGRALAGMRQGAQAAAVYTQALKLYAEIGALETLTSAAQAGLASIAFAQGDLAQARAHVDTLLRLLVADEPVALDEPCEIYRICYRVLEASGDAQAVSLLQRAAQRLRSTLRIGTDKAACGAPRSGSTPPSAWPTHLRHCPDTH